MDYCYGFHYSRLCYPFWRQSCFQKELSLLSVYLIVKGKVKMMNSTKRSLQGLRRLKLHSSIELYLYLTVASAITNRHMLASRKYKQWMFCCTVTPFQIMHKEKNTKRSKYWNQCKSETVLSPSKKTRPCICRVCNSYNNPVQVTRSNTHY